MISRKESDVLQGSQDSNGSSMMSKWQRSMLSKDRSKTEGEEVYSSQ